MLDPVSPSRYSRVAVTALLNGVAGLVLVPFGCSLAAIIFGMWGRRRVESKPELKGRGLATRRESGWARSGSSWRRSPPSGPAAGTGTSSEVSARSDAHGGPVAALASEREEERSRVGHEAEHRAILVRARTVDDGDERLLADLVGHALLGERAACGGVQRRGLPALVLRVRGGELTVDLVQRGVEARLARPPAAGDDEHAADREQDDQQHDRDDDDLQRRHGPQATYAGTAAGLRPGRRASRGARRPCA